MPIGPIVEDVAEEVDISVADGLFGEHIVAHELDPRF